MKKTIQDWKQEMMEEVEGNVFIGCIMNEVPHHQGTKRYQVYNDKGTFDETYDITTDDDGYIIDID